MSELEAQTLEQFHFKYFSLKKSRGKIELFLGGSPGLVVKGGDS